MSKLTFLANIVAENNNVELLTPIAQREQNLLHNPRLQGT